MEPAEPDPANLEERIPALLGIVGLRKDRTDLPAMFVPCAAAPGSND